MLKNLTRGTIVSEKIKFAKSFSDRTFGMLLPRNSGGLIFETRFGLHTFFMQSSIDVLVLDDKNAVRIIKNLKPNNVFISNPKFKIIIELPFGVIEKSKTQKGDKLAFL